MLYSGKENVPDRQRSIEEQWGAIKNTYLETCEDVVDGNAIFQKRLQRIWKTEEHLRKKYTKGGWKPKERRKRKIPRGMQGCETQQLG